MGKIDLASVIRDLDRQDGQSTIYARKPWTPQSEATVQRESEDYAIPERIKSLGFEYFLEVHVAREILEGHESKLSVAERVDLLIYYAENDAFPDWANERLART